METKINIKFEDSDKIDKNVYSINASHIHSFKEPVGYYKVPLNICASCGHIGYVMYGLPYTPKLLHRIMMNFCFGIKWSKEKLK